MQRTARFAMTVVFGLVLAGSRSLPLIGADSHCLMKATDPKAKKVVQACEKHWEANKADCNKFLKATAAELKINDFAAGDDADAIIAKLETLSGWTKLTVADHAEAQKKAAAGNFVVGGLTKDELGESHGHVVVVTAGDLELSAADNIKYPRGYWGKLNGTGEQCKGMNYAFKAPPRKDKLRYYWHAL